MTVPNWLRATSLRGRLLRGLVTLHLAVAVAIGWFSYVSYDRVVHTFMDDQMHELGDSYAAHHKVALLQPVSDEGVFKRGAFVVQVWSADGKTLLATSWPQLAVPLQPDPGFADVRAGTGANNGWRVYTAAPGDRADQPRVQVAQSGSYRRSHVVHRALFEGLPVALLLLPVLLILWGIVAGVSRSLGKVAHDVAGQDEGSLAELPLTRVPDEIAPIVVAFNNLLRRLNEAFALRRRFFQDAAHELRTPITAIDLQIENLRRHVSGAEAREQFAQLEAGVARAQHLIEQLLCLSRVELPAQPMAAGPVDLAALLRESLAQLMVLADRRHIDLGFDGRIAPVLQVPAADLRSLFDNLIDNALRHTPEGGTVDVRLHAPGGQPMVEVIDDGNGMAPELIPRAFDRFYRAPDAPPGGSGLGLAIAQVIASRHGLRIELHNREDRSGLVARVVLPR